MTEGIDTVLAQAAGMSPEQLRGLLRRLPLAQLREMDALLGVPPAETFREFIARVSPSFVFYRWLDPVLDALQEIADGTLTRLLVSAPPRHGKSEVVSRLFPAYFLSRYPWRWVALGAYGSGLAESFSKAARRFYMEGLGTPEKEPGGVGRWETTERGGMWVTGVGGGTGFGSHLGIIDDPIRGRKEASSEVMRQRLMEWYDAVFYTRLEPGGALVATATRWHEDDLTGQLIARETPSTEDVGQEEVVPEGWRVIDLPAIAESKSQRPQYPATMTVIEDWRKEGEPLCPERFPLQRLQRIERTVGTGVWASLFQQRPRPRDGSMFKWMWLDVIDGTHEQAFRVRYWDLAGTEEAGDFTAGTLVAYNPSSPVPVIIEDSVAFKHEPGRRDEMIYQTAVEDAKKYGAHGFHIWIENDPGILGKDRTKNLVAKLAGFVVRTESPSGSKVNGAEPLAAQAEIGNVRLLKGAWNTRFRDVLCSFPHGKHDDEVDSASGAFRKAVALAGQVWGEQHFTVV